jgi:hypothetical protein
MVYMTRRELLLSAVAAAAAALTCACGRHTMDEHRACCRVRMLDSRRSTDTTLQIREIVVVSRYIATDRIGTADPRSVELKILADGRLDVDASVSRITLDQLLERYVMTDTRQRTFSPVSGHACSEVERSLLYYLILEWFYTG